MNVSRLLRLFALTLFSAFSVAPSMHGSAPAPTVAATSSSMPIDIKETGQITIKILKQTSNAQPLDETILTNLKAHFSDIVSFWEQTGTAVYDPEYGCPVKPAQVRSFDWLPGYLFKKSLSRIEGANNIIRYTEENKCNKIIIPQKWVLGIYLDNVSMYRFTLVKKLAGKHLGSFNLEQIKELGDIVMHTGYLDTRNEGGKQDTKAHLKARMDMFNLEKEIQSQIFEDQQEWYLPHFCPNFLFCQDGAIGIIDTEARSFAFTPYKSSDCSLEPLPMLSLGRRARRYLLETLIPLIKKHIGIVDTDASPRPPYCSLEPLLMLSLDRDARLYLLGTLISLIKKHIKDNETSPYASYCKEVNQGLQEKLNNYENLMASLAL